MAKKPEPPRIARIIEGLLPSTGAFMRVIIYQDNSIRIERPYCLVAPKRELPVLLETDATLHRHTIGLLERSAWRDFACVH